MSWYYTSTIPTHEKDNNLIKYLNRLRPDPKHLKTQTNTLTLFFSPRLPAFSPLCFPPDPRQRPAPPPESRFMVKFSNGSSQETLRQSETVSHELVNSRVGRIKETVRRQPRAKKGLTLKSWCRVNDESVECQGQCRNSLSLSTCQCPSER